MTSNLCLIYNEIVPRNSDTGAILIGKMVNEYFFDVDSITTLFFSSNGVFTPVKHKNNKKSCVNCLDYPIVFSQKVLDAYNEKELEGIKSLIIFTLTIN